MPRGSISISELQRCVESKAYAFGTSSAVATLLAEYVVQLLKETALFEHTTTQQRLSL